MKNLLLSLSFFITHWSAAQAPFKEVPYSVTHKGIVLSEEFEYDVLFTENDTVYNQRGEKSLAKRNHDYTCFVPGSSAKKGFLFVSHECNDTNSVLGDGGGGTLFPLVKKNYQWKRQGKFSGINFDAVGGTYDNCGGLYIPQTKRILSAEEFPPENNKALFKKGKGFRDTSDYKGLQRYQNMGWMLEIDPFTQQAVRKLYSLGRFSHESAWLTKDGTVLYMSDDYTPAVFFKFVAETPFSFDKGILYAYQQHNKHNPWIALPDVMDSLLVIRDIAIRKGATLFARMEWMTGVDNKLYLTETGVDTFSLSAQGLNKSSFANHLQPMITNDTLSYPYGSILTLDLRTEEITPFLSGGRGVQDSSKHFSNPDAITHFKSNGKTWLIICEDLIGKDKRRIVNEEQVAPDYINEVWWLDATIKNPTVDSLHRFMISAPGSEPTGPHLSPDKKTLFINVQHPSPNNTPPFNRSCTIAIRSKSWKATYREGKGVDISFW